MAQHLEIEVTGKPVLGYAVGLVPHTVLSVPDLAHYRKEHRRMTTPVLLVGIPYQFLSTFLFLQASQLGSVQIYYSTQYLILYNHSHISFSISGF